MFDQYPQVVGRRTNAIDDLGVSEILRHVFQDLREDRSIITSQDQAKGIGPEPSFCLQLFTAPPFSTAVYSGI
jgi:hypothetical protein